MTNILVPLPGKAIRDFKSTNDFSVDMQDAWKDARKLILHVAREKEEEEEKLSSMILFQKLRNPRG